MERQALYFTAARQVALQTETPPLPSFGQVLVKTVISASARAPSCWSTGAWHRRNLAKDETITALAGDFSFPLKYGYATVGQVIELGRGVAPDWEGRLVFAFHPTKATSWLPRTNCSDCPRI